MVSSTLAASLTCLSLFSCDSILFSFSSSLSSLGGSILWEEPRLVSLLLLLTQLVFCISCPLIFEPCQFFCLSPSNCKLLSQCFSLQSFARCFFLGIFYKPKTKTHPFSYLFFACGTSTLIIFHLISCPLILEPCLFFVYRPLTDSCFLITFLFRTGPYVSFWVFFYAKNKKQNTNSCSYLFFAWGSSNLIVFHLVHTPIFLQEKR